MINEGEPLPVVSSVSSLIAVLLQANGLFNVPSHQRTQPSTYPAKALALNVAEKEA